MAFQALFAREVLPQSFSPPSHCLKVNEHQDATEAANQNSDKKDRDASASQFDFYSWMSFPYPPEAEKSVSPALGSNTEGLLTLGLSQGKLKARRTGFKPYKRCSVEANENRVPNASSHCEEKCPKRLRLEGEAQT